MAERSATVLEQRPDCKAAAWVGRDTELSQVEFNPLPVQKNQHVKI